MDPDAPDPDVGPGAEMGGAEGGSEGEARPELDAGVSPDGGETTKGSGDGCHTVPGAPVAGWLWMLLLSVRRRR